VEGIFIFVLNMSLTASYVITAIMLVRLFLKKAPKVISYVLWAVAGIRLVIPFTFENVFSLIPFKAQPIPQTAALGENISFSSSAGAALEAIGDAANGGLGTITVYLGKTADGYPVTTEAYHSEVWLMFGSYLWVIGIAVLLIYSAVSIVLLNRRLCGAVLTEGNIYEAENLKTPFVLGLFRPKIYIPYGLSIEEKSYIILHEQTHIKRFDYLAKLIAFLILCIHWFNPLVWVAFLLMSADMEMSCDERVLKEMGGMIKKAYSTSLLSLAIGRRLINGSPLAFGEGNIKGRIKNVMNFQKPAAWVIVVSIILVAALSIGFVSNRAAPDDSSEWDVYNFPNYLYDRVTFDTEAEIYPPSFEAINAVLTNQEMESGLTCSKSFTLVKQVGNDWRVVPFAEGLIFTQEVIILPVGVSETYRLTPDMLSVKLRAGNYRIVTEVWYANEQPPMTVRKVWTDFTISETKANMTLNDVRMLAQKGDALKFEDFSDFKGGDASSNINYNIMVYGVEGGYRLIVRSDGKHIDSANLERIWDSGGSGIDIRYSDVDEFVKSHPSSEATKSEPTSLKLSLEQEVGVDMAELDYASDDIVIFHGYFGLFVYDLNINKIVRILDLNPIGCTATQGDNYCEVIVSADGNTVQLHPMSSKNMYVYTVLDNTLQETAYERMENRFTDFVDIVDVVDYQKASNCSHTAVKFDSGEYGYLHTTDFTLGTLTYVCGGDMLYQLFSFAESPSASEKAMLFEAPVSGKVNILIMPTDLDPRYSYYYLPDDQQKISSMVNDVQWTSASKFPDDAYRLNVVIAKDGLSWEMLSSGAFYSSDDGGSFLGENKDLHDEILRLLREDLNFEPFDHSQIKGLSAAEVVYTQHNTGQTFNQRITNSNAMQLLEKHFKSAKLVGGVTACPFYEALMTLEKNDGSVIHLRLATDSCPIYFANGVCFEYEGGNKEIFELFDKIPWRGSTELTITDTKTYNKYHLHGFYKMVKRLS
jgi:beta-lactamase regulating signal transducer with metallopeptidase domain